MTTPITTSTQLEALPINSVILDSDGVAWQRLEANWWKSTDGTGTGGVQGIFSPPWTLLHVPGQVPTGHGPERIDGHWLVEDVKEHTCGAGDEYGHEPGCGTIPLVDLRGLPGWDTLVSDVLTDTSPVKPDAAVAARVTKRLTDAWGWLPNEPEAMRLGANFARSAYLLVAGTRTTPDRLLDALIDGPVVAAPTVKPGRDAVLAALLSVEAGPSTNALVAAVLEIQPGKTEAEVRADERAKIATSLRNMRTTDDERPVPAFLNVADWLDRLADEEAGK